MSISWSRLSLNQKLALVACVLGATALFASPYQGATVSVDTKALAVDVGSGADQVAPADLAAWILAGQADYRLIDIRSAPDYALARIPTAENIPAPGLIEAGLERNEKLILYGDDGVQSAQAWLLLRARGYRGARLLKGGLAAWQDEVLFPVVAAEPAPGQKADQDRRVAIAVYFGGQARVPGEGMLALAPGSSRMPWPTVAPPPAPAGGVTPAKKKKKKEGC